MITNLLWLLFATIAGVASGLMGRGLLRQRRIGSASAAQSEALQPLSRSAEKSSRPEEEMLSLAPPVAAVTALDGEERGRMWLLRRGAAMTIGRSDECDIAVPLQEVSRLHAQLNHRPDAARAHQFTIFDYTSTNGTRVNQHPIETVATLQDGDRIGIGTQHFRFERIRR